MGEFSPEDAPATPGVRVENLRVEYGATTALDGVDLTVEEGEFFTLVGPSGCGKTTTLRCLAGFEEPTAGSVAIGGESMAGVPPEARGVGVVFQSYALFPHMTVGENVAYGLRFSDPPEGTTKSERVADLLELVDLQGFADRDPDTLSGGQQQRVALARALAPEPHLLLLDEPMSALDARLRERLRVQVREIQQELGLTTVYVTHDQEEALAVSDRVAVVDDGRIEQVGPPRELYDSPATRFVAKFLGDNNVLSGSVVDGRGAESAGTGDVAVNGAVGGAAESGGTKPASEEPAAVPVRVLRVGDGGGDGGRDGDGDGGGEGRTLPLPPGLTVTDDGTASVRTGDRVVVCIRPERIRVRRRDSEVEAGRASLAATVESTEFLGDATRLYCDWNGRPLTAKTDGLRSFDAGESVTLGVDPSDVRVVERA